MSKFAKNFTRLRNIIDAWDGGEWRSHSQYEEMLLARLRWEAQYLIAGGPF